MRLNLASRITLILAGILAAGVAMTAALSVDKFEQTLDDLLTSRFEFALSDMQRRIETQMDLGLALNNLDDTPGLLDAFLLTDDQILSIEVFDDTGAVLFSTDPSFIGDLVSDEWIEANHLAGDGQVWSSVQRDARVAGVTLRNNLGQEVGAIALRYSREFFDVSVEEQGSRLLLIGLGVVGGVAAIGVILAIGLLNRRSDELEHLRAALDDVADCRWDGAALQKARTSNPAFAAFASSAETSAREIDAATKAIRKLDDGEAP